MQETAEPIYIHMSAFLGAKHQYLFLTHNIPYLPEHMMRLS